MDYTPHLETINQAQSISRQLDAYYLSDKEISIREPVKLWNHYAQLIERHREERERDKRSSKISDQDLLDELEVFKGHVDKAQGLLSLCKAQNRAPVNTEDVEVHTLKKGRLIFDVHGKAWNITKKEDLGSQVRLTFEREGRVQSQVFEYDDVVSSHSPVTLWAGRSKTCAKCYVVATGDEEITKIFGWRNERKTRRPQAYCKECKKKDSKERRERKKNANQSK